MKTTRRGMVLGKFYPPHLGHQYLFDFARNYVDELAIIVETERNQIVPGHLRWEWVRELCPQPEVTVLHLTDENPQDPSEHPDFWNIWKRSLQRLLPWQPDYLFASENYGWKLSEVLNATFVPVDIGRSVIPVSGTDIRNNPLRHWEYLTRPARSFFAKRVCIFGPESTGKSTLTKNLAHHFQTCFVPEYARTHLEPRNGEVHLEDMEMIARGQMASEDALVRNANRILFCDTDLLTTCIWSHWLFQQCNTWIEDEAKKRSYDLYLVTDVDVPWVRDSVRYLPAERQSFLDRCIETLELHNRPWTLLSGNWDERFHKAVEATEALLK